MISRTAILLRYGVPWGVGAYLASVLVEWLCGVPAGFAWWFMLPPALSSVYHIGSMDAKAYDRDREDEA